LRLNLSRNLKGIKGREGRAFNGVEDICLKVGESSGRDNRWEEEEEEV